MAEIKRIKMLEAAKARQALDDAVIQRSAEKDNKRSLAEARRSGDLTYDRSDSVNSNPSPTYRNRGSSFDLSTELDNEEDDDIDELCRLETEVDVAALSLNDSTPPESEETKPNKQKKKSTPAQSQSDPCEQKARSLVAQIDAATQNLSREEKKKRRKRLAYARKKLGEIEGFSTTSSSTQLTSIFARVEKIVTNFNTQFLETNDDSSSQSFPSPFSILESKPLDLELSHLVKYFSTSTLDESSQPSAIKLLLKLYSYLLSLNHRLHFSQSLSNIAIALEKVISSSDENDTLLLLLSDGGATVVDGCVRVISHQVSERNIILRTSLVHRLNLTNIFSRPTLCQKRTTITPTRSTAALSGCCATSSNPTSSPRSKTNKWT